MMDFQGKVALVTGASMGIGRATAMIFAERNATLVLVDRDPAGLQTLADELKAMGITALTYEGDVRDEARVNELVADAEEKLGKIDILVNNAGIYKTNCMPFTEQKSDYWREKIDINILGTMYFTKAVLDGMIARGYGRIINIASVAGMYGIVNMVDYSMTKGAIISFTKALAKEVTAKGVLVNCVSPGNIWDGSAQDPSGSLSYMYRSGTPRECAEMIVFLASEEASFCAGCNYTVDGCRKKM